MTARDMLTSVLRFGGVLASGDSLEASQAVENLAVLNQMLSSWSNENLTINKKVREEFSFTPSTATYTWGIDGTFNSARPIEIIDARLEIQSADQEIPLKILTTKEYAELSLKDMESTLPQAVYFDGNYPLQNVTFWPVPSAAEKAVFYSLKPFSTLDLSDDLSFPPGYEEAIKFNLWLRLAPEYGKQVDAIQLRLAMDTKALIMAKNYEPRTLCTELPVSSSKNSFDYRTGE